MFLEMQDFDFTQT